MKLSTGILTLIGALSALSYSVEGRIMKRETETFFDSDAITGCKDGINQFEECTNFSDKITKDNIDKYCSTFNSEKCQNLYNNSIDLVIPNCANIPKTFQDQIKQKFDTVSYTFKLLCAKDESGNYCPLSEVYLSNGNSGYENNGFTNALNASCKSKVCVDSAINAFTILENNGLVDRMSGKVVKRDIIEGSEALSSILDTLKSENCTSQSKTSVKQESGDIKSFAVNNTLIIILGLLLLFFNY